MCIHIVHIAYIYIERERERESVCVCRREPRVLQAPLEVLHYGQFSKSYVCFCGLDSGNLKFETVRTNKLHICF